MIQQIMTAPGIIEFRGVETPEPGEEQALAKMIRMGICGSGIHVYYGEHPYTSYPMTQGHEVSREIVKISPRAEHLREGQEVTIEPRMFYDQCHPCTHGRYNDCDNLKVTGFQTTGATSEYFAVDASKIDVLLEGISFGEDAMIEPLAVTIHAAKCYPGIQGANACVLGCDPIDILVAQSYKALGATEVMVTDVSDYRLEMTRVMGAGYAVNTGEYDFGTALADYLGSNKADVIYDCAGNDITMSQVIQGCRKGGTIILVAVFVSGAHTDLAKLNDSELDLNTSLVYTHGDYVDAIRLVGEGKIKLTPLMSKHFAFNESTEAYRCIDDSREQTMKVIIDIQN